MDPEKQVSPSRPQKELGTMTKMFLALAPFLELRNCGALKIRDVQRAMSPRRHLFGAGGVVRPCGKKCTLNLAAFKLAENVNGKQVNHPVGASNCNALMQNPRWHRFKCQCHEHARACAWHVNHSMLLQNQDLKTASA